MGLEEAFDEPAFYLLGGGGIIAEFIGMIFARNMGMVSFPWWQWAIIMVGTLVAAAYFAIKD